MLRRSKWSAAQPEKGVRTNSGRNCSSPISASWPEAAATLVAWLASAESEARLRASDSRNQPVAHPAVADEVVIPEEERFDEADPWHHSIEEVALAMDAAIALALDRLFDDGEDAGP